MNNHLLYHSTLAPFLKFKIYSNKLIFVKIPCNLLYLPCRHPHSSPVITGEITCFIERHSILIILLAYLKIHTTFSHTQAEFMLLFNGHASHWELNNNVFHTHNLIGKQKEILRIGCKIKKNVFHLEISCKTKSFKFLFWGFWPSH